MSRQSKLGMILILTVSLVFCRPSRLPAGAWRPLGALPGQSEQSIGDFVVDTSGTPWIMARGRVYWWDGGNWVQAKDGDREYRSGYYLARFCGGPDCGAYMSQQTDEEHYGLLFRLNAGQVEKVGKFYYDASHGYPGLYVSRSGELFNFASRLLAVWQQGRWQTVETAVGNAPTEVSIADFGPGKPVVFISAKTAKATIWDDERFRTEIPVPNLPGGDSRAMRACRWGKNRLLFWHYHGPGLTAAELVGQRLEPVDIRAIVKKVGPDNDVYGGWATRDGNVLLSFHRRKTRDCDFLHVLADATAKEFGTGELGWDGGRIMRYPRSALHARDGTVWLGTQRNGIAGLRDGKAQVHDWQEGLTATNVNWLFEGPHGRLYAAAYACPTVYRWDPDVEPDRRLAQQWQEIVDPSNPCPIIDFAGNLWVFRQDRPGKVSVGRGANWRDFAVSFDPKGSGRKTVDDRGGMIVEMGSYPAGAYTVGPEGCRHFKTVGPAILSRVEAGARRFKGHDMVGPVVTDEKRVWFGYRGYDHLHAYLDGKWETLDLSGVQAMGVDEKKRVVFLTGSALWTYQTGRLVKLAETDRTKAARFRLLGHPPHNWAAFFPNLPQSIREKYIVLQELGDNNFRPISWQQAEKIAAGGGGEGAQKATKASDLFLNGPSWAVPGPEGGAWIGCGSSDIYRWLDQALVRLDTTRSPVAQRFWLSSGAFPDGSLWISPGYQVGGRRILLHEATQTEARRGVARCEVKQGRHLGVSWEPPSEDDGTIIWRTNLDGHWRSLDHRTHQRLLTKPGKYDVKIETRTMDAVGVLGPTSVETVAVGVRLPRTRWTAELPKCLEDLVWVAPVDADWTAEVPRRIEWRVAGQPWGVLPESRRIPVAGYNNQAVEFHFRAVEEDVFVDPRPLSITIAVEMPLEEVIRRRIDLILSGTAAQRTLAIDDLRAAPEQSGRLLREKISSLVSAESICRQALTEVEKVDRQTTDR